MVKTYNSRLVTVALGTHSVSGFADDSFISIEAVGDGVDWLDATYASMGRGAGNCAMELLLGFLRNPKYQTYPAIQFVQNYMNKLKEDGVVWGYDLQYMMTGQLNQHPRTAIQFTKDKRTDYAEFYKEVVALD